MAWYRLSGVVYTLWFAGIAPLLPRDEREGGRENLGGSQEVDMFSIPNEYSGFTPDVSHC